MRRIFFTLLVVFCCASAFGKDGEVVDPKARLHQAKATAAEFIHADAQGEWGKCYDLLWEPARKLWNKDDYIKFLGGAFQNLKINNPIFTHSGYYPGEPPLAVILVNSSDNKRVQGMIVMRFTGENWEIVLAEPFVAGELAKKAFQMNLNQHE